MSNGIARPALVSVPGALDRPEIERTMALLKSSTMVNPVATVNFSVPDEVKAEFDRVFGGQNKSALIADMMRNAVAEVARRERREEIFRRLTERRNRRPRLSDERIRAARITGRP